MRELRMPWLRFERLESLSASLLGSQRTTQTSASEAVVSTHYMVGNWRSASYEWFGTAKSTRLGSF